MENTKKITLQDVKNAIAFDHSQGIGQTLVMMVDLWYRKAISENKTEEEAIDIALDELGRKMIEMGNKAMTQHEARI